jgi:SAM-dependent methyltransferase
MRIPLLGRRRAKPVKQGVDEVLEFDAAEFRRREALRGEYQVVCDALLTLLNFETVLDIGCANGFLLDPMLQHGKDALGVELSPEVLEILPADTRNHVRIADATTMGQIGTFDLVACVEVIEHLPPARTTALLDVLALNCGDWLYFTAASPYQPGHGHINMRPIFYYLSELRKRGFELDYAVTDALLNRLAALKLAPWLYYNSLVFRRTPGRAS